MSFIQFLQKEAMENNRYRCDRKVNNYVDFLLFFGKSSGKADSMCKIEFIII